MTLTAEIDSPAKRSDIGRRLDALPVGPVHRKVVVAIGLGLFFEVYEIFVSSAIGTALKTEYGLGGTTLMLIMASSFVGMFFGAAAFGHIADRIGRRRAFMINLVWFSVCSLVAAFAPNLAVLVVARFLAGVGIGAEYPVADAYLSDVLPAAHRGRLAAWAYTCSFLAVPVLGFLSMGLTGHVIAGIAGWRILLLIGAAGAVLVVAMRRGLPESPRWLAGRGRNGEAEAALQRFQTGTSAPVDPIQEFTSPPAIPTKPAARLHQSPYRARMVMLAVFHLFQPFGYYGFGTLAALVLVDRGFDVTSSLLFTALSFLGYPLGSLLSIPLLARWERKYLIIASAGAMALCGIAFATVSDPTAIVVFGLLTTAAANVFSNVYHVYQAEIFPSDVRATAVGWTYSLSRLSSAALPFILIPVLGHYGSVAMFAVVVVALGIAVAVLVPLGPRTSGRALDDINPV
ncbi:MFS transporter [Antrihabitans sp. YC2-6]|uniref:MFS transporter n=1 Tax=Antrihabitans sp. YC2-6 TaxID=2799498 RepID=UPI0018F5EA63|nr:MFS transporter [Antrihabitans sp. YC2-6]MBJ8348283.1 MFS transporter [Antrihabitans sp. YC2-6]